MESFMVLWQVVLAEAGTRCGISTTLDLKTVKSRVEREGLEFLTITLPSFAKGLERALDTGKVTHDQFRTFKFGGGLPSLFRGFLGLVFDAGTGRLLDEPSVVAIQAVRQLTLMFGKVDLPCSEYRKGLARRSFVETERQVKERDALRSDSLVEEFREISRLLWSDVLTHVDQAVYNNSLTPKHGPGATGERIKGNLKYAHTGWTERLEEIFPAGEFLLPNWRHFDVFNRVTWAEPGTELPVRVIDVPKSHKTPRLIAIEPVAMQYSQQAIAECLVGTIESTRVGWAMDFHNPWITDYKVRVHNPMRWFVGFEHQEPNQLLAQEGSVTGALATLDLSEASDRVSYLLVRSMLEKHPWLAQAVDATRSSRASVPGYGVIPLAKFASMGSALCFPVEAMVFTSIVFLGIQDSLSRRLTLRDVYRLKGQVRVYGDDIVVPTSAVSHVIARLEAYGLKVNEHKSFWTGQFRESCGKEYFAGEDVTVSRVRRVFPGSRADVNEIVSLVSLRNQLMAGGWRQTSLAYLDPIIEKLLNGNYPVVGPDSPVLGRHMPSGFYEIQRMCSRLHRPLVKGYVVVSKPPLSEIDGSAALLKWFLKRGDEPFADRDHLRRQGRPEQSTLKLGWHVSY